MSEYIEEYYPSLEKFCQTFEKLKLAGRSACNRPLPDRLIISETMAKKIDEANKKIETNKEDE